MLDAIFMRPIAHRGLHDASRGIIENTGPAFEAAIVAGHGIECDLQAAAGGLPVVFHDETLDRLIEGGSGPVSMMSVDDVLRQRHRGSGAPILTLAQFLALVAGRVPLLVEIKSEWQPPDGAFLGEIAYQAQAYRGPLALMSFDPAVMTAMRELAPRVPRGIVSGSYEGEGWWGETLSDERRFALRHLLESGPVAPDFYAYQVGTLPTPVTRYIREVQRLSLFTWTVRKPADWAAAALHADAPIFEGLVPMSALRSRAPVA